MPKQKSLKLNAILNGIKQCFSIIFPLITFPYVSRILGNAGYGKYSFSYSITYYFVTFAALGISTYAIREGAKIRDDKNKIEVFCSQVFSINILSSIVAYLGLFLLIASNAKIRSYAIYILIQSIAIILQTVGTDWINSIYEDYLYITVRYIFVQAIALVAMFVFVKNQNDVWKYCLITTLASNGGYLINVFYVRRYIKLRFTLKMNLKKHIIPLLVLFFNSLAIIVYVNSDITMLGFFSSDSVVGVYSFSSKIYNILKNLINAVVIVSVPRISYILQNDSEKYDSYIQRIFNALNVFLLPLIVGLIAMSDSIIYIAGGKQYLSGTNSLKILSLATLFAIYASLFSNCVLIVNRREKYCLISTITSAAVNIILNIFLIPLWGMNGAAMTTVIAEFLNCILQVHFSKDLYDWHRLKLIDSLPCIIGSGIVFVICSISNKLINSLVLKFVIAVPVSIVIYFALMVFSKNEFVLSVLKKK